jgi:phage-related protein
MKPIDFRGSSLHDLRRFPVVARQKIGDQLRVVQTGERPTPKYVKTMQDVGAGVSEIRVSEDGGIFRAVYVAKFADAVYVLHCFQKKTEETSKHDLEIIRTRHKALIQELGK